MVVAVATAHTNGAHGKTTADSPPPPPTSRQDNNDINSSIDSFESGNYAGIDTSPPIPSSPRQTHKRPSSTDLRKEADDQQALALERNAYSNGEKLTSTAADEDYVESLKLANIEHERIEESRQHGELVSGREAGAGWGNSSIRWAPLNVPLKRRLQTLVLLVHTLTIGLCVTAFFLLCAIPLTWPILLPYLLHILLSKAGTSGTLSRRSDRLRRASFWSLFASYFPARLHRSQVLPADKKYIFGYHPHGIISHGAFISFATEALGFSTLFPGITNTLLTLDSNFRIPLYRDWALALGLASVSKESCLNILSRGGPQNNGSGRAITIVVGGARESLDAHPNTLRLVLRRRKGFVKLAIRSGANLVPVLAFGENELYDQVRPDQHPFIHKTQLVMKRVLGFTIPLFFARGVFNYDVGMMPYRRPLNVVVGRPIVVRKERQPDEGYVDEVHGRYIEELTRMWDEWKDEFCRHREGELEIVE